MANLEGQSNDPATRAKGSGGDIQSKHYPAENEKAESKEEPADKAQKATADDRKPEER